MMVMVMMIINNASQKPQTEVWLVAGFATSIHVWLFVLKIPVNMEVVS